MVDLCDDFSYSSLLDCRYSRTNVACQPRRTSELPCTILASSNPYYHLYNHLLERIVFCEAERKTGPEEILPTKKHILSCWNFLEHWYCHIGQRSSPRRYLCELRQRRHISTSAHILDQYSLVTKVAHLRLPQDQTLSQVSPQFDFAFLSHSICDVLDSMSVPSSTQAST